MLIDILAAAAEAAPQNQFGFWEAMEQGAPISYIILGTLVIMSVGSFYILITKLLEQRKIFNEYKNVRGQFWRAGTLREGATKLDKNSAWRQLVDDGLAGSASIDKVAGPVGEALIMTAIGLLVAVPAVLAYNWLQARNKRIAELLSGFSTDILANITSRGAVRPEVITKTSTQQAGKAAATAPAKPVAKA